MNSSQFKAAAGHMLASGMSVLPLGGRSKSPIVDWQEYQSRTATQAEVDTWSKNNLDLNIAVVTGRISNLTVIDIDGPEGEASLAGIILPETYTVLTGKGRHLYYRYTDNPLIHTCANLLPKVDIRSDGGYVVGEHSTHPDGGSYMPVGAFAHIAPFPESFIEYVRANKAVSDVGGRTGKRAAPIDSAARNSSLTSLAGTLREKRIPDEAIRTMVSIANDAFPEPLADSEVRTILNSVLKYDTNEQESRRLTELGVAERFCDRYKDIIRYNVTLGRWMIFNGRHWEISDTGIYDRVRSLIRSIPDEIEDDAPANMVETYDKFARGLESHKKFTAILNLCKEFLAIKAPAFDSDPARLNVANATFHLTDGTKHGHDASDLLSKCSPVAYDKSAACPLWQAFLSRIFDNNNELISYIQRLCGYCLTGSTKEQAFFMLFGTGANGKSVFIDTLRYILGDYALQTSFSTFLARKDNSVPNDLAAFQGKRVVCATESSDSKQLNDSLIKSLTGDGTINARFLYHEFFEFEPQCKVLLATNHKPIIRDDSVGMWRRLRLIPFTVTIPDEEKDRDLLSKLRAEASGILNWMLDGYKQWKACGLGSCAAVEGGTDEYKYDSDSIGRFIDEMCDVLPTATTEGEKASTLYQTYVQWCEDNGDNPMSGTGFGRKLVDRGHQRSRNKIGRVWTTIKVRTDF